MSAGRQTTRRGPVRREPARGKTGPTSSARLWGGGFEAALDPALNRFCSSFAFDRRLLRADLAANRAWVVTLREAGVLNAGEAAHLLAGLAAIESRHAEGVIAAEPEDVHTFVETCLTRAVGADLAGKLRTGRSRNDLVATDLRLHCREEIGRLRGRLTACVRAEARLAERCGGLAVPGYTHLRRAQPILLAHLLLAHAERLMRDDERLEGTLGRLDVCPLGSGALAGTTLAIDRDALARRLGFSQAAHNSIDAVSDRDFVADTLYACALVLVHLSQAAEDLILATTEEFGWLALDDAAATGSSLMPQKKNPDPLELIRGRAGRVVGRLTGFLTTLKGLPAAYNRDLQEDKEALFEALDVAGDCLQAMAITLDHLRPVLERGLDDAGAGDLLATDLADYLVERGLPFAEAHRLAGVAAARARRSKTPLARLPLAAFRKISPLIRRDVYDRFGVRTAIARRAAAGGTAPARVAEGLRRVFAWCESSGRSAAAPGRADGRG